MSLSASRLGGPLANFVKLLRWPEPRATATLPGGRRVSRGNGPDSRCPAGGGAADAFAAAVARASGWALDLEALPYLYTLRAPADEQRRQLAHHAEKKLLGELLLARNGGAELDRLHHRRVAARAIEILPPPSRQHPRERTPPPRDERREEHDAT